MNILPFVYVSCPYTDKDPEIVKYRMLMFAKYAAMVEAWGKEHACSALFNQTLLDRGCTLPATYSYWQSYSRSGIHVSKRMVVLCLKGWKSSAGVQDEIAYALSIGLDIEYVTFPEGY